LSHLQSFVTKLQTGTVSVGDLMIAAKLSGEIIGDFNEIIEEIVEQRRALIASVNREIQAAKQAGDNFFEFMEKRFMPDMFVRFSRDSVEAELYDLFVRTQDVVEAFLGVLGITVFWNPQLNFIIADPPGSDIPGVECGDPGQAALQRRIHADEAGLLIPLRLLYEEKILEGEIDEQGCVFVPLETVFTRYSSITKKEMPAAEAERRSLFQTLKQLRLVAYSDLTGPDQWIGIREIIMHFTLNGVVDALAERECPADGAGGGPESMPEVESFDDENRPEDDGEDET